MVRTAKILFFSHGKKNLNLNFYVQLKFLNLLCLLVSLLEIRVVVHHESKKRIINIYVSPPDPLQIVRETKKFGNKHHKPLKVLFMKVNRIKYDGCTIVTCT